MIIITLKYYVPVYSISYSNFLYLILKRYYNVVKSLPGRNPNNVNKYE